LKKSNSNNSRKINSSFDAGKLPQISAYHVYNNAMVNFKKNASPVLIAISKKINEKAYIWQIT
jgi:hypothetical protein